MFIVISFTVICFKYKTCFCIVFIVVYYLIPKKITCIIHNIKYYLCI